jgi:hypothetical protein
MSFRITLAAGVVLTAGALAVAGLALATGPAEAAPCDTGSCRNAATAKQPAPLVLDKFRRRPVTSAAARSVKTSDGSYAQVATARRAKPRPAAARATPAPAKLSPEAARAYASDAGTEVRVVAADEVNELDLAADSAPIVPVRVTTTSEAAVQVVQPGELNAIDQLARPARKAKR